MRWPARAWARGALTALVLVAISVLACAQQLSSAASAQEPDRDARYFAEYRLPHRRRQDLGLFQEARRHRHLRAADLADVPVPGLTHPVLPATGPAGGSNGVHTLNLLDDGLLPYTTINGSTFPAVDPSSSGAAPRPVARLRRGGHRVPEAVRAQHLRRPAGWVFRTPSRARSRWTTPSRRAAATPICCRCLTWRSGACRPRSRARSGTTASSTCASSAASCTTTRAASAPRGCSWAIAQGADHRPEPAGRPRETSLAEPALQAIRHHDTLRPTPPLGADQLNSRRRLPSFPGHRHGGVRAARRRPYC